MSTSLLWHPQFWRCYLNSRPFLQSTLVNSGGHVFQNPPKNPKFIILYSILHIEMWLYSSNTAQLTQLIQMLHSRNSSAVSHTNVHLCTSLFCIFLPGFYKLGCKVWAQVQREGVVGFFHKVDAIFFWVNYRNLNYQECDGLETHKEPHTLLIPALWWMKLSCRGTLVGNEEVFIYYVQKQSNK